jgi:transcriptional regulator with XRE-family HTH domain
MPGEKNICGPAVKYWRKQKGLSQRDLAGRMQKVGWDLDENLISKIEKRFRRLSDQEVLLLAEALDVEIAELFQTEFK